MNRKQRRRAAKDLSLRLNKLKGYARKGSARATALLVLAKKQWSGEGITEEEMMAFNGRFEQFEEVGSLTPEAIEAITTHIREQGAPDCVLTNARHDEQVP